ncbi:MAG: DUF4214 domain-containing protein [Bryobacteraceae bacterium]
MGDLGDGRLYIVILEHWWKALRGVERLPAMSFFFPVPDVLAYSDCAVLYAIPYSVLRAVGVDVFLAFQWSMFLVSVLGFLSTFWLLIRHFDFDPFYAAWGAILVAAPNQLFLSSLHPQLLAVSFVPLIVFLGMEAATLLRDRRIAAGRWLLLCAGLLLSALFLTSFYVAWFALFSGVILIVLLALRSPTATVQAVRRFWPEGIVFALAVCVGLVPFLMLYLPAARSLGGRPFGELFLAHPSDLVNIGPDNLFWRRVIHGGGSHELQYGWPPVTLALFLVSAVYAWWPRSARAHLSTRERSRLILTRNLSLLVLVVLALLVVQIGPVPAWLLVYRMVPGALAIRTTFRGALVLNGALVLTCLSGVWLLRWRLARSRSTALSSLLVLLAVFSLLEQTNAEPMYRIDRVEEDALLERIPPPPAACRCFFVWPWPTSIRPSYGSQVDAMLISERFNLPTLNGYSGWLPRGWNLNPGPDYQKRALDWAYRHSLASGLCRLNLPKATWALAPFPPAYADPLPGDVRFVNLMYTGFLGRQPSQAELNSQTNTLQEGKSRSDVAMALFDSAEFNNNGGFVAAAYVGILGRDADYASWLGSRAAMDSGALSPMQLTAGMLNSAEYHTKYGAPAADVFVKTLYNNALRRDPAPAEMASQLAVLEAGISRAQSAYNLLTGSEFQRISGPRIMAVLVYACMLQRDAKPRERDYWANLVRGGMTVNQLFDHFVNSAEMEIRLRTGIQDKHP